MSYVKIDNLLNKCAEPQEYNFEAESDVSDLSDKSTFEKFFTYQAAGKSVSPYVSGKKFAEEVQDKYPIFKYFDCDGSGGKIKQGQLCMLSRNIYRSLWGWKDIEKAEFENKMFKVERYGNCGIREFGDVGPDTMNSANTLLDRIVKNIVKSHQDMEKIRGGNKYSIRYVLELFVNKQTRTLFIKEISLVPYLKEYLDEYHKMGNIILVPAYFNTYRAQKVKDFWIESLVCLKEKQKDDEWIYKNRGEHKILWDANNFILYINYFFLWDYFDENGNLIDYTLLRKNDVSEYMRKTVNHIKKRSIFMTLMLKVYCKLGEEKYEKLRKEIFVNEKMIYKNYDEVFEKISIYLNNISDELLKEECEKSKLLIDKVEKANEYANKEG